MLKILILIGSCLLIYPATVSNTASHTSQNEPPVTSNSPAIDPVNSQIPANDTQNSEIQAENSKNAEISTVTIKSEIQTVDSENSSQSDNYRNSAALETEGWDDQHSEIELSEPFTPPASPYEEAYQPFIIKIDGVKIHLCPLEDRNDQKILKNLSKKFAHIEHCLFEKTFTDEEEIICQNEAKPILIREKIGKKYINCAKSKHKLYTFAFLNCFKFKDLLENEKNFTTQTLLMYEICYDDSTKRTIWTKHIVLLPPQLLEHTTKEKSKGGSPFSTYTPKNKLLDSLSINAYDLKEPLFKEMKSAFQKQKDISKTLMKPQMLVPREDLLAPLWVKATDHMINIAPLWDDLSPLMNAINDGIRSAAVIAKVLCRRILQIYSTAFMKKKKSGILSRFKSTSVASIPRLNLNDEKLFPIPEIWSKFIYSEEKKLGVIIIIHNTPNEVLQTNGKYCSGSDDTIKCDFTQWSSHKEDENLKQKIGDVQDYAYCCKATRSLIRKLFKMDKVIKGDLDIEKILNKDKSTMEDFCNNEPEKSKARDIFKPISRIFFK